MFTIQLSLSSDMKFFLDRSYARKVIENALNAGINAIDTHWQDYLNFNLGESKAGYTLQTLSDIASERKVSYGSTGTEIVVNWTDGSAEGRSNYLIEGTKATGEERDEVIAWAVYKLKTDEIDAEYIMKSVAEKGTTYGHLDDYPPGEPRFDFPEDYIVNVFPWFQDRVISAIDRQLGIELGT